MGEKAFALLRGAILSGALRPGESLRIKDLAKAIGVSRMPIREALAQLEQIGLVEMLPRRSARVALLSRTDLKDVYDVRLMLEVPAVSAAAREFEEQDLLTARGWFERLRLELAEGNHAGVLEAHAAFHLALYRANSSRWLVRLISLVWDSSERYRRAATGPERVPLAAEMEDHERLLAACRAGEAEVAGALLWNHLAGMANTVSVELGGGLLYERRSVGDRSHTPLPAAE
jgi:DNA-binding GntR family transcriptional regulator